MSARAIARHLTDHGVLNRTGFDGVPVASKKFWSDMPVSCGDAVAAAGL
jgi:hypothetical protein